MPNIFQKAISSGRPGAYMRNKLRRKIGLGEEIGSDGTTNTVGQTQSRADLAGPTIAERLGLTLLLDPSSLVDRHMLVDGFWELDQLRVMERAVRHLGQGEPFLDMGAYWGLYGLTGRKAGAGEVHFFEAEPKNFAQLNAQLFLNRATYDTHRHFFALSDREGSVHFLRSDRIEDGNRGGAGVVAASHPSAIEIAARPLDSVLSYRGRTLVGKIDVEGHEPAVLRGMRQLVAQNRVFLQTEIFESNFSVTEEVFRELGLRAAFSLSHDYYLTNIPDADLKGIF